MGPRMWQKSPKHFFRVTLLGPGMICGLLLGSSLLSAQTNIQSSIEMNKGSHVTLQLPLRLRAKFRTIRRQLQLSAELY